MSSSISNDAPVVPRKPARLRQWLLVAAVVLLTPLVAAAALWFGPSPRVVRDHVQVVRGPDGAFGAAETARQSGIQFEAHAGTLLANDSMSSSCASSRGDRARFACRRLAVFSRSEHLFALRTCECLVENLKGLSYVDQIDYYPPGIEPEEGGLAPDVSIVLDLEKCKESGLLWRQALEADVTVAAGNRLVCSNSFYHDGLAPPQVEFSWRGRLVHRSTTTGLTSSAAKYKQVAEHCAKQIADSLRKQFDADREKYGVLEKLPEAFYPAYNAPQELPFRSAYPLERVVAWHGLMNHCDAVWRIVTDQPPAQVLGNIRGPLERVGWKVSEHSSQPMNPYLRATRGSVVVQVFPEREDAALPSVQTTAAAQPPNDRILYVHYLDRMTDQELAGAVDRTVSENSPLGVLLLFQHSWTLDQCRQVLGRLEARRPSDPDGWLTMASIYQRMEQSPKARDAVLKAHAMESAVPNASELSGRIQSLAKSLGDESLARRPIDVGLLKDAGFVELKPNDKVPDREIGADEAACYYASGRAGKVHTFAIRMTPGAPGGSLAGRLTFIHSSEGSKSWSSGGPEYAAHVDGLGMVRIAATALPGGQRLRVSAQASASSASR